MFVNYAIAGQKARWEFHIGTDLSFGFFKGFHGDVTLYSFAFYHFSFQKLLERESNL